MTITDINRHGQYVLGPERIAVSAAAILPRQVPGRTPPTRSTTPPPPAIAVNAWGWRATCLGVAARDCKGVAKLFINNLARGRDSVFNESGGRLAVEPRPECPPVPDYADGSFCWQASAAVADGDICMVVARHVPWVLEQFRRSLGFGQVGGDDLTGRPNFPNDPPRSDCV